MNCGKTWKSVFVIATALGCAAPIFANDAQTQGDLKSAFKDLKSSCKDDISKYCNDIKPGQGRLAACLNSNSSNLSSDCNSARQNASSLIQQAHMDLEKSCGS